MIITTNKTNYVVLNNEDLNLFNIKMMEYHNLGEYIIEIAGLEEILCFNNMILDETKTRKNKASRSIESKKEKSSQLYHLIRFLHPFYSFTLEKGEKK